MTHQDDLLEQKINEVLRRLEAIEKKLDSFEKRFSDDEIEIAKLKEKYSLSQVMQYTVTIILSGLAALSQFIFRK